MRFPVIVDYQKHHAGDQTIKGDYCNIVGNSSIADGGFDCGTYQQYQGEGYQVSWVYTIEHIEYTERKKYGDPDDIVNFRGLPAPDTTAVA